MWRGETEGNNEWGAERWGGTKYQQKTAGREETEGRWRHRSGWEVHTTMAGRTQQQWSLELQRIKEKQLFFQPWETQPKADMLLSDRSSSVEQITDSQKAFLQLLHVRSEPKEGLGDSWGAKVSRGRENKEEGGHFGKGPLEFVVSRGETTEESGGGDTDVKCSHLNRHVNIFSFLGYKSLLSAPTSRV